MDGSAAAGLVAGGVMAGVLAAFKLFDIWKGWGEDGERRTLNLMSKSMEKQTEILIRYGVKMDKIEKDLDCLRRWHAEEIPGQPGQKIIWNKTHDTVRSILRNLRLVCQKLGITFVD